MPTAAKATPEDLTALILETYRSKAAFAEAIGIPPHTLYSILSGDTFTSCSLNSAMAITKALALDPYAFAEGRLEPATQTAEATPVPVYDELTPGKTPHQSGQFPVPAKLLQSHPSAFMLRIQGDVMDRVLPQGHLVLIAPNPTPKTKSCLRAISLAGTPAIVRRVILHHNGLTLAPESFDPTYKPRLIDFDDPKAPKITHIGRVIWHCAPIE